MRELVALWLAFIALPLAIMAFAIFDQLGALR